MIVDDEYPIVEFLEESLKQRNAQVEAALKLGIQSFLFKPVKNTELYNRINSLR